jgi:queuine tRNA-ribosyltransferase
MRLHFEVEKEAPLSRARAGKLRVRGQEVATPAFMPVGTNATVRNQRLETLRESGSRILLANTYHLLRRPGPDVLRTLGGIHRFMGWDGLVLTDSGGFQAFSLASLTTVTDEGIRFKPHPDAAPLLLSPRTSLAMQSAIGSDIRMVFDHCVPSNCDRATAEAALERTQRWAQESLRAHLESPTAADATAALFGIVQGACFEDLRRRSAEETTALAFDGFAIGGLAVGETRAQREDMTELTAALLPPQRPRYLMGVGTPVDLLEAVHRGVDLFDCILPVSLAQQGVAYTRFGRIDLDRGVYALWKGPIDPDCGCGTCRSHSRAYLRHLIKASEPIGWQLIGAHNLHFYHALLRELRERILEGDFASYYSEARERLARRDPEAPARAQKPKRRPSPAPRVLGNYRVIEDAARAFGRIEQISSGEIMHPADSPIEEASAVYVSQSRLAARAAETAAEPLVLWDVGLGAGANLLAAIRVLEESQVRRPIRCMSFERDLDSLRLALQHTALFTYLRHGAPPALLERGHWRSSRADLECDLVIGDFLQEITQDKYSLRRPEIVFFDPFSTKTDGEAWTLACFENLLARCAGGPTELYTYSSSTAVRARLLAAGWFVARGVPAGSRPETTVALSPRAATKTGFALLAPDWLEKWRRSGAKEPALTQKLEAHPQFSGNFSE